jgi:hypothetical protein
LFPGCTQGMCSCQLTARSVPQCTEVQAGATGSGVAACSVTRSVPQCTEVQTGATGSGVAACSVPGQCRNAQKCRQGPQAAGLLPAALAMGGARHKAKACVGNAWAGSGSGEPPARTECCLRGSAAGRCASHEVYCGPSACQGAREALWMLGFPEPRERTCESVFCYLTCESRRFLPSMQRSTTKPNKGRRGHASCCHCCAQCESRRFLPSMQISTTKPNKGRRGHAICCHCYAQCGFQVHSKRSRACSRAGALCACRHTMQPIPAQASPSCGGTP